MLKSVVLKNKSSLDPNTNLIKINFSEKVNVIIGPKGGGKSTLFDLVAGLKKGYISKTVIDALSNYNLEFVEAVKFNGEKILVNQLSKKTRTEKDKDFESRNDVIFQDDPIKKNINSSDSVEKEKFDYIKKVIEASTDSIDIYIKKIEKFYNEIKAIIELDDDTSINWTNTFLFKKIDGEINIISQLNYNSRDIKLKFNEELFKIKKLIEKINDDITFWKTPSSINFTHFNIDDNFNEEFKFNVEKNIEQLLKMKELLISRNKKLMKIHKIINCFEKAYQKRKDEIKKQNFKEQGLKSFEKETKDYFKNFARKIVDLKKDFSNVVNNEIKISLNSKELESKSFLSYRFDERKVIGEDLIFETLKLVLHTPRSFKELSRWISENKKDNKEFKEFDTAKIINLLARTWKKDVKVYANGKDYETMSLGQRSIYGILYKFNKSKDEDLFLDQPEDNLDNNTIATNILEMLKEKNDQQVFIVTHNANIGILSSPQKIIVADLNNKGSEYSEGKLISTDEKDSECSFYLEGGSEYLERRFKIVKGIK